MLALKGSCAECLHYCEGYCHRFPPVACQQEDGDTYWFRPEVDREDHCGEFMRVVWQDNDPIHVPPVVPPDYDTKGN